MFKRNFVPIMIVLMIVLFVINPHVVHAGVLNGLSVWIKNIVPFLFPMSILSNILLQYNFLYRLSDLFSKFSIKLFKSKYAPIPFVISFITGYPSGALAVNIMASNKRVSENEANFLVIFANNCSFQFIAATIAYSMLGDYDLFMYIALPHFLGALILSFFLNKSFNYGSSRKNIQYKPAYFPKAFSNAISKSLLSILSIGGVIVFFSILSNFINIFLTSFSNILPISRVLIDILYSTLVGCLEITNGCSLVAASEYIPINLKLVIINFLISFSGISVFFQTVSIIDGFNLKIKDYLISKFVHGLISSCIAIVMIIFFQLT